MNKEIRNLIYELKADTARVHRFDDSGTSFGMLIIGRGEELFFQKGDRALLCEISARYALINIKTIKRWDDGTVITDVEKRELIPEIIKIYKLAYRDDLKVFENK